jgi:threonine dehydrogenase-like Zn-dependent dehydrogenase
MTSRSTRAAVAVGNRRFEVRDFALPAVRKADGILRVESCGVCGSDLKKYRADPMKPTILGHETVGTVEDLGAAAHTRWGVSPGDRVLLEEYLPCGHCTHCRIGEYRSCRTTDNTRAGALRYGSTPIDVPPAVWGGYSQYQYLHPSSVLHRVPDSVSAEDATFGIPLSNGVQWTQIDGGVSAGDVVLVLGPGQQGMSCLVAALDAGAGAVLVAGRNTDTERLVLAGSLGAARTVDVDAEDPVEVVRELTGDAMADVVIDVSGSGAVGFGIALRALRVGGTFVAASGPGGRTEAAELDLAPIRKKRITIKGVRGHSYIAVERALRLIAEGRAPTRAVSAQPAPLADIEDALAAAGGHGAATALHVIVDPWR